MQLVQSCAARSDSGTVLAMTTSMPPALSGSYTPFKVHQPLAAKLDVLAAAPGLRVQHLDRYSVEDGGIESQVQRHCALYPLDPDVVARKIPISKLECGKDASTTTVHGYPVVRISPADIHESLVDSQPCAVAVRVGATIFFRIEMSAVQRSITRRDGEDQNAYTSLVTQSVSHLSVHGLRVSRWSDDVTRVARESLNWNQLTAERRGRGVLMSLANTEYDLSKKADRSVLSVLGAVGSENDPERRRQLVGGRLTRMVNGGAVLAEQQMPTGWKNSSATPRAARCTTRRRGVYRSRTRTCCAPGPLRTARGGADVRRPARDLHRARTGGANHSPVGPAVRPRLRGRHR